MSDLSRPAERLIIDAVGSRIDPTVWDRFVSIVTDADILVLAVFCLIGLLLSLTAMLLVPSFTEATEVFQQLL